MKKEDVDLKLKNRIEDLEVVLQNDCCGPLTDRTGKVYESFEDWVNWYFKGFRDDLFYQAERLDLQTNNYYDEFFLRYPNRIEYHYVDLIKGEARIITDKNYEVINRIFDLVSKVLKKSKKGGENK